jgi:hypothetical protein
MVDVNDLVNEMTSSDFTDTNIVGKVEVAYRYCSAIFGGDIPLASGTVGTNAITTSETDHGVAIALLAERLLIEGRKITSSKTDPTIPIRTTEQLFTEEMRNMLIIADVTDPDEASKGVMWNDSQPTERWDV